MPQESDANPEDRPKKFRITRKRLGKVRFVDPNGEYGFIEAEDFRDDVYFHFTTWRTSGKSTPDTGTDSRENRPPRIPRLPKLVPEEIVNQTVEFELDDEFFEAEQRLRAKVVRPSRRPMGRKLSGRDATFKIVTHHPNARRKRPDWRK